MLTSARGSGAERDLYLRRSVVRSLQRWDLALPLGQHIFIPVALVTLTFGLFRDLLKCQRGLVEILFGFFFGFFALH